MSSYNLCNDSVHIPGCEIVRWTVSVKSIRLVSPAYRYVFPHPFQIPYPKLSLRLRVVALPGIVPFRATSRPALVSVYSASYTFIIIQCARSRSSTNKRNRIRQHEIVRTTRTNRKRHRMEILDGYEYMRVRKYLLHEAWADPIEHRRPPVPASPTQSSEPNVGCDKAIFPSRALPIL